MATASIASYRVHCMQYHGTFFLVVLEYGNTKNIMVLEYVPVYVHVYHNKMVDTKQTGDSLPFKDERYHLVLEYVPWYSSTYVRTYVRTMVHVY
jgi:hypothetical protein